MGPKIQPSFFFNTGAQHPQEIEWLVAQLEKAQPKSVLEIGCGCGGTTTLYAAIGAWVVSVDAFINPVREYLWNSARVREIYPNLQIVLINADSHADGTRNLVNRIAPDGFDWVVIDGDHSLEGGQRDWDLFSSMARQAVLVHDIYPYQEKINPSWWPFVWAERHCQDSNWSEFTSVPSGGWGMLTL